jgi:signal transduction histidine kinase
VRLGVLPIGIAFGLGAEWTRLAADWPMPWVIADALPGMAILVAGQYAWARRPEDRIGPLMVLTGFAWFVGTYGVSPDPVIGRLGYAFQGYYDVLLVWLVLAYPTGRLRRPILRLVVTTGFVVLAIRSAGRLAWFGLSTGYDLADPLEVERYVADLSRLDSLDTVGRVLLTTLSLVAVGLVARRLLGATRADRRVAGPVLLGGVAIGVATLVETGVLLSAGSFAERASAWGVSHALTTGTAILVPVGFAVGLARGRLGRAAVADLVVELGRRPEDLTLRDLLAGALGDPSLVVGYPAGTGTSPFVDDAGLDVVLPAPDDPHRGTTRVEGDDGTLAVLVHDRAIIAQAEPVRSILAAARLALENERLAATVHRQLEEVQASRARIVAAEIAERRRVERDLHDGAQQRLVTLAVALQVARGHVRGGEGEAALEDASEQLRLALRDLRELSRGLHPQVLSEDGLASAVDALLERSPVPVSSEVVSHRYQPAVEAAAYFVVAEALANLVKHAEASSARVTIREAAGRLSVEVSDDGRGGADARGGSGLSGLADRVAAAGGRLRIESPPGAGTTVHADIPCA